MPSSMFPAAVLMLLAAPAASDGARAPQVEQWTIRQRIMIRIPAIPTIRKAANDPDDIRYVEKKAPKCVAAKMLVGSAITRPDSIDFSLSDGNRMRARLGKHCPALDFYSGFYLKPDRDGTICANRDSVRSRAGDECQIDGFKKLLVKR